MILVRFCPDVSAEELGWDSPATQRYFELDYAHKRYEPARLNDIPVFEVQAEKCLSRRRERTYRMRRSTFGLQSFRLQHFKAVRDSGEVELTPLTVFIGNNGSGKSSLIEGLEMFQIIATRDVNAAMHYGGGFDQIINTSVSHKPVGSAGTSGCSSQANPMSFALSGVIMGNVRIEAFLQIAKEPGKDVVFVQSEKLVQHGQDISSFDLKRNDLGKVEGTYTIDGIQRSFDIPDLAGNTSLLHMHIPGCPSDTFLRHFITNWQFVRLAPEHLGKPTPRSSTDGPTKLARDGSNIAEYLLDILNRSPQAFHSIIQTVRTIMPYTSDLQLHVSELERTVSLELTEKNCKIPGELLSTGTLRFVTLLALMRHPTPPPLLVIEEIENGLDPNSIHCIVDEIQRVVENGKMQIILTTHSPYLLGKLVLDHLVFTERIGDQAVFARPGDDKNLQKWAEKFDPGRLYLMNKLSRKG